MRFIFYILLLAIGIGCLCCGYIWWGFGIIIVDILLALLIESCSSDAIGDIVDLIEDIVD